MNLQPIFEREMLDDKDSRAGHWQGEAFIYTDPWVQALWAGFQQGWQQLSPQQQERAA